MVRDRETARFAGISDLAAEKVIVQENRGGRLAGGWQCQKSCGVMQLKCTSAEGAGPVGSSKARGGGA